MSDHACRRFLTSQDKTALYSNARAGNTTKTKQQIRQPFDEDIKWEPNRKPKIPHLNRLNHSQRPHLSENRVGIKSVGGLIRIWLDTPV